MENGWTGGQYSVYRVVLALALASHFGWIGFLLSIPLALGAAGAWPAGLLLGYLAMRLFSGDSSLIACALLALHLVTPAAPYGSWDARQRTDPDNGWRLAGFEITAARILSRWR